MGLSEFTDEELRMEIFTRKAKDRRDKIAAWEGFIKEVKEIYLKYPKLGAIDIEGGGGHECLERV